MRIRDYQQACVNAVVRALARSNSVLCCMFTGSGKTVVFAQIANTYPEARILVICPMRELAWQGADVFQAWTGERPEIEMAAYRASDAWWGGSRVVVASRQTLLSGRGQKRYERFLGFDLIIVDEAHTQFSEPVLDMLREFQLHGGKVIGMTATPFRQDGRKLLDFYDEVAFDYGLKPGIEDAWCVPPVGRIVRCQDLDLRNVSISGGDYSAADLDMVMGCSRPLHQLCLVTQQERVGPAIAFLPGVASARAYAEMAANQYGMRAAWICGNTFLQSEDERNRVINQFRRGELDVLANCQIATMGFDAPVARTVILGRPTKSRSLWLQIVGRVTRPEAGSLDDPACHQTGTAGIEARRQAIAGSNKPYFKIIDITDASGNHSIRTSVDMFAKDDTPKEVIRRARQLAEEGEANPEDMLAQAAEDVRKARLIEDGLRSQRGQAGGRLHSQDLELTGGRKCVSQYRVPLRGKYAGQTMGEVPDDYIRWALKQPWLQSWQRRFFAAERSRRAAAQRDSQRAGESVSH